MARKKTIKDYISETGRRKGAVARIRLFKGRGEHVVNDLPGKQYFIDVAKTSRWLEIFELTKTQGKYFVTTKITGGGKKGQLGAFILAIAKAFVKLDSEKYKPTLRQHGFLTRDARIRERRKVGTGGKARRKKQSPKR